MKIKLLLIVLLTTLASVGYAKIPSQVKKSVAFIFSKDSSNRLHPQGTGFFVLLNAQQNNDTINFGYLVTSKATFKKSNGSFLDTAYIRINKREGQSDTLIIPLIQNGVPRYFIHSDSAVDLVIIPAYPDLNRYDFLFIPAGMIAQIDIFRKENLSEGDEVFYTGMLNSHFGIFKNIPIVRFGKIAQVSDEKYFVERRFTDFYLMELSMAQGSAGSPLYFYASAAKDTGNVTIPAKFFLLGIISGKHDESGLAKAVPAYKLSELLNMQAVVQEREKEFLQLQDTKKK